MRAAGRSADLTQRFPERTTPEQRPGRRGGGLGSQAQRRPVQGPGREAQQGAVRQTSDGRWKHFRLFIRGATGSFGRVLRTKVTGDFFFFLKGFRVSMNNNVREKQMRQEMRDNSKSMGHLGNPERRQRAGHPPAGHRQLLALHTWRSLHSTHHVLSHLYLRQQVGPAVPPRLGRAPGTSRAPEWPLESHPRAASAPQPRLPPRTSRLHPRKQITVRPPPPIPPRAAFTLGPGLRGPRRA